MGAKYLLSGLLLLLGSSRPLLAQEPDRFFYQYFTGTVGPDTAYLHLQHSDGQYTAYLHQGNQPPALLEGTEPANYLVLSEVPPGSAEGLGDSFKLEWGYGRQLSGLRISADSSRQQAVILHPARPAVHFEPLVREYLFQKTTVPNKSSAEVPSWEFPISFWLLQAQSSAKLSPELQENLGQKLLNCAEPHLPELCLNQQALEAYTEATAENTLPAQNFMLQRQQYLLHQNNRLVVIREVESSFWGGAHGNHRIRYINLDLSTGRQLRLTDIFRPEQLDRLAELVVSRASTSTRAEEVRQELGEFYLTPGGLGLTFNTYSIGSYADGPQEFFFSFAELVKALGSVTVAQSYIY